MKKLKQKIKNFNETIDKLRSILYSCDVNPVENISDDFLYRQPNEHNNNDNNNTKKEV